MGNDSAGSKRHADSRGWRGVLAALSGGAAAVWLGVDQLHTPDECEGGHRIIGRLSEWLCLSVGGTGTGTLYILIGVVALFAALMWQRHGA